MLLLLLLCVLLLLLSEELRTRLCGGRDVAISVCKALLCCRSTDASAVDLLYRRGGGGCGHSVVQYVRTSERGR